MAHIKCETCGEMIPLTSGVGPVGAKRFTCPKCGHDTDFGTRPQHDDPAPEDPQERGDARRAE